MIDSANDHGVGVSLEVEEGFEVGLKVVFFRVQPVGFELLADEFFD